MHVQTILIWLGAQNFMMTNNQDVTFQNIVYTPIYWWIKLMDRHQIEK